MRKHIGKIMSMSFSLFLINSVAFADALPPPTTVVPEPSTFLLFGAGVAGVALLSKIKRK